MSQDRAKGSRRIRKIARRTLLGLATLPLLYLLAALVGSLLPRNPGWREPPEGVLIFVRSNGVHADVVLPASAAGVDLYRLMPPAHVRDSASAGGWIALGWGQREFYLETPRWADLSARNAVRSVVGGDALMHVEHLPPPSVSPAQRPLRIEAAAYRRLAAAAIRDFVLDGERRSVPLLGHGYGSSDVFYEARGRYSALRTSNQWTADVLAEGGVEIGVWTPFAQGIMWRFRDEPNETASRSAR